MRLRCRCGTSRGRDLRDPLRNIAEADAVDRPSPNAGAMYRSHIRSYPYSVLRLSCGCALIYRGHSARRRINPEAGGTHRSPADTRRASKAVASRRVGNDFERSFPSGAYQRTRHTVRPLSRRRRSITSACPSAPRSMPRRGAGPIGDAADLERRRPNASSGVVVDGVERNRQHGHEVPGDWFIQVSVV